MAAYGDWVTSHVLYALDVTILLMALVLIHLLYFAAKLRVSHTLGNFLQHEEACGAKGFTKRFYHATLSCPTFN